MDTNTFQGFPSIVYTSCDFATFDENNYFANFHYYEVFDETKEYSKKTFKHDYGYGNRNYQFCLYEFRNILDNAIKKYVVVNEILTGEERWKLKDYCGCKYCLSDDNKKMFMDQGNYSCLLDTDIELDSFDQKVIDDTRERMKLGLLSVVKKEVKKEVNLENDHWSILSLMGICIVVSAYFLIKTI